jgi:hypothetical protein
MITEVLSLSGCKNNIVFTQSKDSKGRKEGIKRENA